MEPQLIRRGRDTDDEGRFEIAMPALVVAAGIFRAFELDFEPDRTRIAEIRKEGVALADARGVELPDLCDVRPAVTESFLHFGEYGAVALTGALRCVDSLV